MRVFPLSAALCSIAASSVTLAQSSFQGIGFLPGADRWSAAYAVSGDGAVVTGAVEKYINGDNYNFPVRWTLAGGLESLTFPGAEDRGSAKAVSGDGSVIVGSAAPGPSSGPIAFRWNQSDGLQYLTMPAGFSLETANGASQGGAVIVGTGVAGGLYRALRWTPTGVMSLGAFPGAAQSYANDVSADGLTVVGDCAFIPSSARRAFRWTYATGMIDLGSLSQLASSQTWAEAVSADGTTVVGASWVAQNVVHAFRWTPATGIVDLGTLPGHAFSYGWGTSHDGAIVVGTSYSGGGTTHPFLWSQPGGMRRLRDVLTRDCGLDLRGWCLTSARAVSADGSTIVGDGENPQGENEGWVAHLDVPLAIPACDADWDRNGFVTGDDFDGFVSAFYAGERSADYNGDCFTNGDDFDSFVTDFEAGC